VDPELIRQNLVALRRAEARRARTPGVNRWFVELHVDDGVPEPLEDTARTATMRIPRLSFGS
jgi:hypothetical protein